MYIFYTFSIRDQINISSTWLKNLFQIMSFILKTKEHKKIQ